MVVVQTYEKRCNDLSLNRHTQEAHRDKRLIEFTAKEFDLQKYSLAQFRQDRYLACPTTDCSYFVIAVVSLALLITADLCCFCLPLHSARAPKAPNANVPNTEEGSGTLFGEM